MNCSTKVTIFDLDGTLIDTMGGFADIAADLIREYYGWSFEKGRREYLMTSGIPFFQQLDKMFPTGRRNAEIADKFENRKLQAFICEEVEEKTIETLYTLKTREVRTVISSNNFHDLVREFATRNNLPVDLALGYKPDFGKGHAHFSHIQQHFGVPSSSMVFIGDSLRDAEIARENKLRFVAKLGTFSESDFKQEAGVDAISTVYEINELLDVLEVI